MLRDLSAITLAPPPILNETSAPCKRKLMIVIDKVGQLLVNPIGARTYRAYFESGLPRHLSKTA
jgi:hypothetical protein